MTFSYRCLLAALLPIAAHSVMAEEDSATTTLDPVVITATRTAQSLAHTLASTTVIDRAEIERRQAQSVPDLLRGVPGISISNDGGLGKNSSLYLRGTEGDHVLVLIDGIRAGSVTLGSTAFQDLPVDQIDRIEVVRGPRASLYGSEAIGGVIQIFTRKGGKELRPYLSVGAGSHDMYKVTGGISGGDDRYWYSLNGARIETRGFNSCDGRAALLQGGCYVRELDDDGYRNTSGSARVGYRFANGLELEGNFMQAAGDNDYDGQFQNRGTFVQQLLGGSAKFSPTDFWTATLRAGRTLDQSENFKNRRFSSRFDSQRVNLTWQNDFVLAEGHTVTAGLDFFNDQVDSTVTYSVKTRDNKAGFVQYQASMGDFDAVLGARYDDNEQFGSHASGNFALGYRFGNGVRLTASWGNAFKAPSFNELYYPGFGSANLLPESSESWEAGVDGKHLGVNWSLHGFHTEIDQMIASVYDPVNCTQSQFRFCAQNVDQARILGLEAQLSTQLWGFDVAATLSLTDPENLSRGANHGTILARRSQAMFRFDIDRAIGPVKLGATVHGEDRRYEDVANQYALAGFVTVDLRGSVAIYKGLSLEGRIANLLDEQYETSRLYYQDDRNFLVTMRYQPDAL